MFRGPGPMLVTMVVLCLNDPGPTLVTMVVLCLGAMDLCLLL